MSIKSSLSKYETIIFDCDGVILNSNKIKTLAFFNSALPYGEKSATKLIEHHLNHGGISRYAKFDYFLNNIVSEDYFEKDSFDAKLKALLDKYAQLVHQGLMKCEIASGLEQLRIVTPNCKWLIVSGGDEKELNHIFSERNLKSFFDGGIFGSPNTKVDILSREIANGNITQPALFIGDSKYDYLAATKAGLDFIFLSGWSEINNWKYWSTINNIQVFESIKDIVEKSL